MQKLAMSLTLLAGLFALGACGKGQEYADAVCACKDSKCIAETTEKYKDSAKDLKADHAKKIAECTGEIVKKETGMK